MHRSYQAVRPGTDSVSVDSARLSETRSGVVKERWRGEKPRKVHSPTFVPHHDLFSTILSRPSLTERFDRSTNKKIDDEFGKRDLEIKT